MKVQLTTSEPIRCTNGEKDVEIGFGAMGEAISFHSRRGAMIFTCLFYGLAGLFYVDAEDLRTIVA